MLTEYFIDLCFVRAHVMQESFVDLINMHLKPLFSGIGVCTAKGRLEGQLDIVVAEVKGFRNWEHEEMILDYLEKEAHPQFWEWLQGVQIRVDIKEHVECSHCSNG